MALWREIVRVTADPLVGVSIAEMIPLGALGFVYHSLHVSSSLRDALGRAGRYARFVSAALELAMEDSLEGGHFRARLHDGLPEPPTVLIEYLLRIIVRNGVHLTEGGWKPLRVSFRHRAPAAPALFEERFGCPVLFSQPRDEVVIPHPALSLVVPTADASIRALLDREADAEIAHRDAESAVLQRLRPRIEKALEQGEPVLTDIAAEMKCSARSLQRWLSREGTQFSEVVDRVRRDLALRWNEKPALGITEIAFLVGFSEASAFHRAFRRWTGKTPAAYRKERGA